MARLGARITALDISPTFVRHARQTELEQPLGIDYQIASGAQLPFADKTFDLATALMSLMEPHADEKNAPNAPPSLTRPTSPTS